VSTLAQSTHAVEALTRNKDAAPRRSSISYPPEQVTVKRPSLVRICDGNHCAGALISQLHFEHDRLARSGRDLWQDGKLKSLCKRFDDEYGLDTMRKAVRLVESKSFIKRRKKEGVEWPYDQQKDILFCPEIVQAALDADPKNGKKPNVFPPSKNQRWAGPAENAALSDGEPESPEPPPSKNQRPPLEKSTVKERIKEEKVKSFSPQFSKNGDRNSSPSSKPKAKPPVDGKAWWSWVWSGIRRWGVNWEPDYLCSDGHRVDSLQAARIHENNLRQKFINEYRDQHPGENIGTYETGFKPLQHLLEKFKPKLDAGGPPKFPPAVAHALTCIGGSVLGGLKVMADTDPKWLGIVERNFVKAYDEQMRMDQWKPEGETSGQEQTCRM
jgi:hypothetical protein